MGIQRGASISKAYVDNNVLGFSPLIRKVVFNFKTRAKESKNELVRACTSGLFFLYGSHMNAKWHSLLY